MLDENTVAPVMIYVGCDHTLFFRDAEHVSLHNVRVASRLPSQFKFIMFSLQENVVTTDIVVDKCAKLGIHFCAFYVGSENESRLKEAMNELDLVYLPTFSNGIAKYHRVRAANKPETFMDCLEYFSKSYEPITKENIEAFLTTYGS